MTKARHGHEADLPLDLGLLSPLADALGLMGMLCMGLLGIVFPPAKRSYEKALAKACAKDQSGGD